MNRIITISREFGSGGRTIGKQVAERLGIPCYDGELIDKTAEKIGFTKEYIEEHSEDVHGSNWFDWTLGYRDSNGHSFQDDLHAIQCKVIRELAEKGPCVIVGRCADHVLKDYPNCLHVFIHASMESRAKRIVEQYGERSDSPEKRLREKDKRRAAYYQFYTDLRWGNAHNYHISLDSSVLGLEKCVDLLVQLY